MSLHILGSGGGCRCTAGLLCEAGQAARLLCMQDVGGDVYVVLISGIWEHAVQSGCDVPPMDKFERRHFGGFLHCGVVGEDYVC